MEIIDLFNRFQFKFHHKGKLYSDGCRHKKGGGCIQPKKMPLVAAKLKQEMAHKPGKMY